MTPSTRNRAPETGRESRSSPTASKRFGYAVSIVVNLGMLYLVHHILPWGWPGFVTEDWDRVLPVVSLSIVATIIANTLFLWFDRPRFAAMLNLMTTAVGLVAAIRMWQVFPFDFGEHAVDWSLLVRAAIAVTMFGASVGCLVEAMKLGKADAHED
jgi:hypothetical protein